MDDRPIDQCDYVRRLLEAYRATPGTSGTVRRPDRVPIRRHFLAATRSGALDAAGKTRERASRINEGGRTTGALRHFPAERDGETEPTMCERLLLRRRKTGRPIVHYSGVLERPIISSCTPMPIPRSGPPRLSPAVYASRSQSSIIFPTSTVPNSKSCWS
jgi:hypothetical protein